MLARRATWVIVLVTTVATAVPLALLSALAGDSSASGAAVTLVALVWGWLTWTFTWGALSVAAVERVGVTTPSEVFHATFDRFGKFLAVTLLLLAAALGTGIALVILAVVGLGDTTTAPLLAILTPVFLVVGGFGLLVLVATGRLAFAAVAVDACPASAAVRRALALLRTRLADVLFWMIGDAALVGAGIGALTSLIMTGALLGVLLQGSFFVGGVLTDFLNGDLDVDAGAVAVALWLLSVSLFGSLVAGVASSFSAGTGVGFYQAVQGRAPVHGGGSVCGRCGAAVVADARFCDRCGLVLTPA